MFELTNDLGKIKSLVLSCSSTSVCFNHQNTLMENQPNLGFSMHWTE